MFSFNNLTVKFEDGQIRYNVNYSNFLKGCVSHPCINPQMKSIRLGEKRLMNCGMYAEIVAYRNAKDIDVLFEDDTLFIHKSYGEFVKGAIFNKNKYVGLKNKMNCGLNATIIKVRTLDDLDIEFEDGTVVLHKRLDHFKIGNIKHPNRLLIDNDKKEIRLGETKLMNNGMTATITDYYGAANITITFDDNTEVTNVQYCKFIRGRVANPNFKKGNLVGTMRLGKFILKLKDNKYYDCTCEKCGKNDLLTPHKMLEHKC